MSKIVEHIHWLGHDSFRIDGPVTIYVDPWKLPAGAPQADLILITHDHFDHCSPEDVEKIRKADTVVVTIAAAAKQLKGNVQVVKPGDKLTVKGIPIEAVSAYNVNKKFHPKNAGHVGFIFTVAGQRIYHTGDAGEWHLRDDRRRGCAGGSSHQSQNSHPHALR